MAKFKKEPPPEHPSFKFLRDPTNLRRIEKTEVLPISEEPLGPLLRSTAITAETAYHILAILLDGSHAVIEKPTVKEMFAFIDKHYCDISDDESLLEYLNIILQANKKFLDKMINNEYDEFDDDDIFDYNYDDYNKNEKSSSGDAYELCNENLPDTDGILTTPNLSTQIED